MAKKAAVQNVTAADVPVLPWEGGGRDNSLEVGAERLAGVIQDEDEGLDEETAAEIDNIAESGVDEWKAGRERKRLREHTDLLEGREPRAEQDEAVEVADEADDEADDDELDEDVEDGDKEEAEPADEPMYKVKIDGEVEDVPLSELIKGYSRHADYVRKTQEIARERREVAEDRTLVAQAADEAVSRIQAIDQFLGATLTPEQRAAFARHYQAARAQQDAAIAEAYQRQLAEAVEALPSWIPEWRDGDVKGRETKEIAEYLGDSFGVRSEELAALVDPRLIAVARKAMLYDRMQVQNEKSKQELRKKLKNTPVMKPGAAQPPVDRNARALKIARQRLAQSGSVHDAAAIISQQLIDD